MPINASKLPVITNVSAMKFAETIFGDGVTVVSASYRGDLRSAGIFNQGSIVSPGAVPSADGVILSTGLTTAFTNASGYPNTSDATSGKMSGVNNDPGMNAIAGVSTFDGAFVAASIVPVGETLTMHLVFGSEEYLEWVKSGYNHDVGIWVNGKKINLAIGDGDISIDNINTTSNRNVFISNTKDIINTEMDGLTTMLTLKAVVVPGVVNTIRIGIADTGDAPYDRNHLLVADPEQTALIATDDAIAVTMKGETTVNLMSNDLTAGRSDVRITHLNDTAVTAGKLVILTTGDTLRLNVDGTVTILATKDSSPVTFSYTITDALGRVDTAFVTITPSAVDGTAGNDQMHVGFVDAHGNRIDGTDGLAEVIMGYAGHDKITAGLGADDIYGGTGNDFIRAGHGADLIFGGDGHDVLDGQAGADTLQGGAGNDVYHIDNAGDLISETGGSGHDKVISSLSHTLGAGFEELWLAKGSVATIGTGNALNNKIVGNALANTLAGDAGADQLFGEGGHDQIFGGLGNDSLYAGTGRDELYGGDGDDRLFGGAGRDQLFGGAGRDVLVAGSAGDVLSGGAGNDNLSAGAGADLFVFSAGSGLDAINGFVVGVDHLLLDGVIDAALKVAGTRATISFGEGDVITLTGLTDVRSLTLDSLLY